MAYIMAHDFGTSSAKAALYTTEGKLAAASSAAYKTTYERPGYATQNADDWWRAFCENNRRLLQSIRDSDIAGVSFSSTNPNCLLVGKDREPLHEAMIWQDSRAKEVAQRISPQLPKALTARAPGGVLNPDRTLAKLLWIKENTPEVFAKAYKLLPSAAGYIQLKLSGAAAVDYGIANNTSMIERGARDWNEEVLAIAGVSRELLPELHERTDVIGTVSEAAARECGLPAGTKIFCGTADAACTAIGGGLLKKGDTFLLGGTSAEINAIGNDGRKIGRPSNSSGASLTWMRNNIAVLEKLAEEESGKAPFRQVNRLALESPVGSNGVIFLPYLAGERGMRYDNDAKGSFTGISLRTTRADLVRSVIEGIGYNLNLMLTDIRKQGIAVTRLPIVGGLGKGEAVVRIFADIFNTTIVQFQYMDYAATAGAAVLAGMGLGLYEDESAVCQFMPVAGEVAPIPENHEAYRHYAEKFEAVYQALKPVYAAK